MKLKKILRYLIEIILIKIHPNFKILSYDISFEYFKSKLTNSTVEEYVKLYPPYHISNTQIGKGTYISQNAYVSLAKIGRFCSIGPNLICGWGIHPTQALSTSPSFYSVNSPNGLSLSEKNKVIERKIIEIGNDVFIGMNVTILDGITIGDGAIIGAGAIVSKDIPPYAIAVGAPIQIIRYRFSESEIKKFLKIQWWNFEPSELKEVEKHFFEINKFIEKFDTI
ncbi:MAG: CatB-related O-acetyltransferase [Bacteroidota bacterium]